MVRWPCCLGPMLAQCLMQAVTLEEAADSTHHRDPYRPLDWPKDHLANEIRFWDLLSPGQYDS